MDKYNPRIPKGYRRIKVGEKIAKDALFFPPSYGKYMSKEEYGEDFTGGLLTGSQYGFYFVKVWKEPADFIFNSIFPTEEMDREDSEGYIAALIQAKYTESEFRKACAVMAKERLDALGEE